VLTLLSPLWAGLLIFSTTLSSAANRTFGTVPNDEKNVVQFISNATLERVVGRTDAISGSAVLNLDDVAATTKASFEVDLRTVDTGIAMRNQDMRTNYLETDEYPKATFTLTKIVSADPPSLTPEQTVNIVAEGLFTIHGVTKTYQIPIALTYTPSASSSEAVERLYGGPGDLVNVTAEWSVRLADHGIIRPSFLFMRLAEEQRVSVAFALTDILPKR
jgi:polyisoprenoid-binding protein YceI